MTLDEIVKELSIIRHKVKYGVVNPDITFKQFFADANLTKEEVDYIRKKCDFIYTEDVAYSNNPDVLTALWKEVKNNSSQSTTKWNIATNPNIYETTFNEMFEDAYKRNDIFLLKNLSKNDLVSIEQFEKVVAICMQFPELNDLADIYKWKPEIENVFTSMNVETIDKLSKDVYFYTGSEHRLSGENRVKALKERIKTLKNFEKNARMKEIKYDREYEMLLKNIKKSIQEEVSHIDGLVIRDVKFINDTYDFNKLKDLNGVTHDTSKIACVYEYNGHKGAITSFQMTYPFQYSNNNYQIQNNGQNLVFRFTKRILEHVEDWDVLDKTYNMNRLIRNINMDKEDKLPLDTVIQDAQNDKYQRTTVTNIGQIKKNEIEI